jgi:hypothetical protein
MSNTLFKVSGIDPNAGASVVFVWHRDKRSGNYAMLGSGHVVRAGGPGLPSGVQAGQFSVTIALPPGGSADNVVVTDDKGGKEILPGVVVAPCSAIGAFSPAGIGSPQGASGVIGVNGGPDYLGKGVVGARK